MQYFCRPIFGPRFCGVPSIKPMTKLSKINLRRFQPNFPFWLAPQSCLTDNNVTMSILLDALVHEQGKALKDKSKFLNGQLHTGFLLASFYADDILLFVRKLEDNLPPLLREITRFGVYSGLVINWSKSQTFALTPSTSQVDVEFPLNGARSHLSIWELHFISKTLKLYV